MIPTESSVLGQTSADLAAQQSALRAGAMQTANDYTARFGPYMGRAQEAIMRGQGTQMSDMGAMARRANDIFGAQQTLEGQQFNQKLAFSAAENAAQREQAMLMARRALDQRLLEMKMKQEQAGQLGMNQLIGGGLTLGAGAIGGMYGGPLGASVGMQMGQGLSSSLFGG